jgi:hypothetical protein
VEDGPLGDCRLSKYWSVRRGAVAQEACPPEHRSAFLGLTRLFGYTRGHCRVVRSDPKYEQLVHETQCTVQQVVAFGPACILEEHHPGSVHGVTFASLVPL